MVLHKYGIQQKWTLFEHLEDTLDEFQLARGTILL